MKTIGLVLGFGLLGGVLLNGLSLGCSGETEPAQNTGNAGADAGEPEAGLVCDGTGISKGPWVLAIDGTSAKVRWEACREGTTKGLSLAPEAGGNPIEMDSVETPAEVTETNIAPLNPSAPVDWAATYYMHEAALTGLLPGTCYTYALLGDSSRKGRFCTAAPAGTPIRFMAIGDTNPSLGDNTINVLSNAIPKGPDFTLHCGDIQYYSSTLETWASWFPVMQVMLSQGGFFPSVGNHESETPKEFDEYFLRFFKGAGFGGTDTYYRFETGGVYFFALNTEDAYGQGTVQGSWLEAQLNEASKAPGYRFSVVFMHRTLVTCGDTGQDTAVREQFEPIFQQYKVPLVIQGHMHGYERFDLNGITYVTTGGGGGSIGNIDENIERPECAMRLASGAFSHAVIVDVTAADIQGTVIHENGIIADSFTLPLP